MIRVACACLAIFALAGSASAQEWARKMFAVRRHDFGAVARGAKAEFEFELSNIYKEDVHITGVRSSCGCTTPRVTKETLKTYEKSAVVATFNTRSFLGQKSATLTVTFDQPFYAEVQLQVSGYIRSDIVLEPGGVEFGSVDQGSTAEQKIKINYAGRGDWSIVEVKSGSPYLEAEVTETARGRGQVSYELTARLLPEAPAGYIKQQLVLVTNDRRAAEVPVDVEGRVVSALTVSPASLFLGTLKPGQKVTKQVVVQGKKPFHVTSVTCDDDCFTFRTAEAAKPVHLIPITFIAGDTPGKRTYKIRIETDLGGDATCELLAYVQVVDPAAEVAGP